MLISYMCDLAHLQREYEKSLIHITWKLEFMVVDESWLY